VAGFSAFYGLLNGQYDDQYTPSAESVVDNEIVKEQTSEARDFSVLDGK
jgi:nitrogen fixation-related uncharacterized protein